MWTENFQMFKLNLEKAEESEISCQHPLDQRKSRRAPEKNIYFCFFDYAKAFDCVDHNEFCLLRNLYAHQEAIVRTRHGTTDWFQTGKGARQGCILSSCLFNLYAGYIMWNAGLDETQAGIKIAGRNISNSDDTTLTAESKEGLKNFLIKMKKRVKNLA